MNNDNSHQEPPECDPHFLKMLEKWNRVRHPSKEHELLKSLAGEWDVLLRFHAGDQSWESSCIARKELIHEGRFLLEQLTGEIFAPDDTGTMRREPYSATRLLGYDNFKRGYVGAFIENQNTSLLTFIGRPRLGGNASEIDMYGEADEAMLDLHDGTMRYTLRVMGQDDHLWEVYALAAGPKTRLFDFIYTRCSPHG